MQWKNASLKYESQTDRLILKVLTPNYANAVLNFQNRNRESFEAYDRQDLPTFISGILPAGSFKV